MLQQWVVAEFDRTASTFRERDIVNPTSARRARLLRQPDKDFVPPCAEGEARLRRGETHDDPVAILEPKLPLRLGGDGEAACALDPGAGELGDVTEPVDLAGGLQRGDRAKPDQRAGQREWIGPAPEGEDAVASAHAGDKGLRHRDRARRPEPVNARRGRDPRGRDLATGERQKT
jgi:hypothetical protein